MSRLKSIFILIAFVLWIVPLGAFIRASDEKKVCGGQRAICLCKGQPGNPKKLAIAHSAGTQKENASSANSSHFLAANFRNIHPLLSAKLNDYTPNHYVLTICESIEHVPKV